MDTVRIQACMCATKTKFVCCLVATVVASASSHSKDCNIIQFDDLHL